MIKKSNNKGLILFVMLTLCCLISYSQTIIVQNPSFEGMKGAGIVPSPWVICYTTPDTNPNIGCGIDLPASNGKTYLGLWCSTSEAFGQSLSFPLTQSKPYFFSIDLAREGTPPYYCGIIGSGFPGLKIWLGTACGVRSQLIWQSDTIKNIIWEKHKIVFTPNSNYSFIEFEGVNYVSFSYLLLDNMSNIFEAVPKISITSPSKNTVQSCIYGLWGQTDSLPIKVKIKSKYLDTLTAKINYTDTSWSIGLDYAKIRNCSMRIDTIISIGYFSNGYIAKDTTIVMLECLQDSCLGTLPNLITPNNDDKNETFEIVNLPIQHKLEIYNRWGQRIFESTDYKNDWQGEEDGVYFYLLITEYKTYKGWVQVIR